MLEFAKFVVRTYAGTTNRTISEIANHDTGM